MLIFSPKIRLSKLIKNVLIKIQIFDLKEEVETEAGNGICESGNTLKKEVGSELGSI